jgi:membrane associated rhomboid family serine protease
MDSQKYNMLLCWSSSSLWIIFAYLIQVNAEQDQKSSGGCDEDSIGDAIPLSKLAPNQFHKICPSQLDSSGSRSGQGDKFLGQPICGDGTNFSFFVTKPIQRKANTDRILIEFMGGGACWDEQTCTYNAAATTFPQALNDFVGFSCSEVAYAVDNLGGYPISLLCSRSIGNTDFTEYSNIIVPYCTQDIHIGDQTTTYEDGTIIHHRGGHNTMGVLRWLFKNFDNPSHIVLTGCSAGGSILPVVYDLIRKHYSHIGRRTVQISIIADSPVYLTPEYFLENGFGNWNPETLTNKIGFNYKKWRYSDEYSTRVWGHVLKRGHNKDQWGIVTHNNDPISLAYFQWMSGEGDENRYQRNLNNNKNENENDSEWFKELTSSLNTIQKQHKNVETYFIDKEGHCSFGLYYPMLEDSFQDWAFDIVEEQNLGSPTPAPAVFFLAMGMAFLVFLGGYYSRRRIKREITVVSDEAFLDDIVESTSDLEVHSSRSSESLSFHDSCVRSITTFPITVSYLVAITVYFLVMISSQGFVHPLNNPSLGPSPMSLSHFGINNPSLIIYRGQFFRLISSSFLCSGVITFLLVVICLWFYARPLEKMLRNDLQFICAMALIIVSTNVCFALIGHGASCSSVALVLGLNVVYIILRKRFEYSSVVGLTISTVLMAILVITIFPFNSGIMILIGMATGAFVGLSVLTVASKEPSMIQEDGLEIRKVDVNPVKISSRALRGFGSVFFLMFLVLLFRLRRPNRLYLQPYYTSCNVMYIAGEDVDTIINTFGSSYRYRYRRRSNQRQLNGYSFEAATLCAEFCIPHLVSRLTVIGAEQLFRLPLTTGVCDDIGYDVHIADKTVVLSGYSLDFEIFTKEEEQAEENHK